MSNRKPIEGIICYLDAKQFGKGKSIDRRAFKTSEVRELEKKLEIAVDAIESLKRYTSTTFKVDSKYVSDKCSEALDQIKGDQNEKQI